MLIWLLAGIVLLCAVLWLVRWMTAVDPKLLALLLKSIGVTLLVLLGAYFVLSGRVGWLLGLLPFLLPFALRRVGSSGAAALGGMGRGPTPRTSHVRTRFLDMRLNHEHGDLDGEVLEGLYAGQQLSELSLADLMELARLLMPVDRDSVRLLEAYLDRRDPDWRTSQPGNDYADAESGAAPGHEHSGSTTTMNEEEAYRVLGLAPGANEAEIKQAYHRLIAGVHPDKGGSSFLAAQVNRAKDILLKGRTRS